MPFEFDLLLKILQLCLLALLYLFFFRVLQSTIRGTKSGAGVLQHAPGPGIGRNILGRQKQVDLHDAVPNGVPSSVVLIQPPDLSGQELQVVEHLTFGRATSCDVTLDDTYLSQVHMRVSARGPAMVVEDLGSTNGTYVNDKRLETPVRVAVGDRIRIGETVMELR